MQLTPIDDRKRIWQIENLLPPDQVAEIVSLDWLNMPWEKGALQESWLRRNVKWDCPPVQKVSQYISDRLADINNSVGTDFKSCHGHFWVDEPGFTVQMHTDGHLPNAMQLYWIIPSEDYGTGFYYHKNKKHLMYQFTSRPNTGYLMLNHNEPDESQPLLWHAMLNPVPAGSYRISSYWYFYK